jgi:hypothetical protein
LWPTRPWWFLDIHNLESYGSFAECCFLLVATDHDHYVNHDSYSPDTSDFDFRQGKLYNAGTIATYRTTTPYGNPITLNNSYQFVWNQEVSGLHFLQLAVNPKKS